MRDNYDGISLFELKDQLFNFPGRDGIERGARFVHQQNFRLNRQRPRNTQPLLLPAREAGAGFLVQVVFRFAPQGGGFQ